MKEKPTYENRWKGCFKENGACYYAIDIYKNIVPNVKTDRHWVALVCEQCQDHSIVFIHNNWHPQRYEYLKKYNDLILVCSQKDTMKKVKDYGTPIYLPLSVDTEELKKYKRPKTKDTAYFGRMVKLRGIPHEPLKVGTDMICGDREMSLKKVARYKNVYAVGRCALEAKALGCNILPFDFRFPDPDVWEVIDNKDAAKMLQKELDKIDKEKK